MDLASEPDEIGAIAAALEQAPVIAFDLEFASADRLTPQLCLVQVSWVDEKQHRMFDAAGGDIVAIEPTIRLLDPLAGDVAPVIAVLARHPCVIAHAPRQDLALLAGRFGLTEMPGLVDTQLEAAFAGVGDQVGLANLANDLLGTSLGKDQQWTAWEKRPLTGAQLVYAASDVRYLHALHALLARRLQHKLAWVREESQQILADALAAVRVTPETAWEQVGGARVLDADAQARVKVLAQWRQQTAIALDRPLGQVLGEKNLLDLARHRPRDAGDVRAQKGIAPIAKSRAGEIMAALDHAVVDRDAPPFARPRAASARAQRWAEMLLAIAHVVADEQNLAARLLATRGDAETFARIADEHGLDATAPLPARATWRREILGPAWTGWLAGTVAIVGDASTARGVSLVGR